MAVKTLEEKIKNLEQRIIKLEKLEKMLPRCDCGYLLMGCEGGDPEDKPWHMQCWRCGSWYNVEPDPFDVKPTLRNFKKKKLDDKFFYRHKK